MNGDVPDSWDEPNGDPINESKFASLNVGAKPFVPNVNAAAFVPSFSRPPPAAAAPVSLQPPAVYEEAPSEPPVVEDTEVEAPEPVEEATMPAEEPAPAVAEEEVVPEPEAKVEEVATPSPVPERVESATPPAQATPPPTPVVSEGGHSKEDHLNVIFIGHVDAGKSTIGGQLMFLTGMVDKRTLEKYEREAKEKNRETWYLSWALDTNQEERDKGKTVEVGRAYFETETKHFTILDAPGHRSYVPNMIGGASQADVAVLVISARRGEFETGFERGGQTREHAMLARTAGVQHLVVLINKMDDSSVKWSEKRYNECKDKLYPFLKTVGFNPKKNVHFMPCSGMTGTNLKVGDREKHPWYDGLALIPYLDGLPTVNRSSDGPVRLPIVDRYKDMGVIVLGKVESGMITKGQHLVMQPNKRKVKVLGIQSDEVDVESAKSGENVKLRIDSIEEEEISKGFVLCSPNNLCSSAKTFLAQIAIIEFKSIICAGYSAIMHIHSSVEEVTITKLVWLVNRKTGKKERTRFVKQDQTVIAQLEAKEAICIEPFENFQQMGRFTLRDENRTIAIGKVLKIKA